VRKRDETVSAERVGDLQTVYLRLKGGRGSAEGGLKNMVRRGKDGVDKALESQSAIVKRIV